MALTKSVSLRLPPAFLFTKIVRAELQREAKAKPKAAKR
jgi:hypothetical protein